ncbi:MAG: nucleoside hydrolase, partial [Actinobacteria bacterium]|nr:nucleoside hydrolase [Actinomycetota bacterium]
RATPGVRERMSRLGRLGRELLLPVLAGYRGEPRAADPTGHPSADPPVHDVCAVALVADPGLFGCHPALVEVETAGRLTVGMTVTTFGAADPNALVALSIDTTAFWDLVLAAFARVPPAQVG